MRLVRQLLAEALLLSCVGGALGAAFAYWAKDLLVTVLPQNAFRSYELTVDARALSFAAAYRSVAVEGVDSPSVARVGIQRVQHDFFATIDIPVLSGRAFNESDRDGVPKIAVISEALARQIPGGAPGRQLFFDFGHQDLNERFEIVGIVKDVRSLPPRLGVVPIVYLPEGQSFVGAQAMGTATFIVRTAADPMSMAPAINTLALIMVAARHAARVDPTITLRAE